MTIKAIPCISVNRCNPRSCSATVEFDDAIISVCCQKHRHLARRCGSACQNSITPASVGRQSGVSPMVLRNLIADFGVRTARADEEQREQEAPDSLRCRLAGSLGRQALCHEVQRGGGHVFKIRPSVPAGGRGEIALERNADRGQLHRQSLGPLEPIFVGGVAAQKLMLGPVHWVNVQRGRLLSGGFL
jgi:hypothetical protein